jgi:hypothetical protein
MIAAGTRTTKMTRRTEPTPIMAIIKPERKNNNFGP